MERTLREKFHQWLKTEPFSSKERPTLREAQLEVIADEFAIEFGDWIGKNTMSYNDGKFRMKILTPVFFTSEQLLEQFKKEKGL